MRLRVADRSAACDTCDVAGRSQTVEPLKCPDTFMPSFPSDSAVAEPASVGTIETWNPKGQDLRCWMYLRVSAST